MAPKQDAALLFQHELEQAKAGTHHRIRSEEKRLGEQMKFRVKEAEEKRQVLLAVADVQYQNTVAEAEEEYNREKQVLTDQVATTVIERHKRTAVSAQDQNSLRICQRRYKQTRSDAAVATKAVPNRDKKITAYAQPLLGAEVEEDCEAMAKLAEAINPSLDVSGLEVEMKEKDRDKPMQVVKKATADTISAKRPRRADFNFKGKARGDVSGSKITVWYEEEHGGRAIDVPYIGIVNSSDPREGLYVKFDDYPEEMLITNEDDWRWGAHSRKPPAEKK